MWPYEVQSIYHRVPHDHRAPDACRARCIIETMQSADLIVQRPEGLYCPVGDFFIDPWRPVARAVVTHAHADHSRPGHGSYLAHRDAQGVMRERLGNITFQGLGYDERIGIGDTTVSLHPAGHVLGSAQVRIEHRGQVWVASGDYFTSGVEDDTNPTCVAFEPVRCHCFVTESTFGLPIYRWSAQRDIYAEIDRWWADTRAQGRNALLMGYSFGKAQRLLAGVDASIGPIWLHPAVDALCRAYRAAGVALPEAQLLHGDVKAAQLKGALVIAPPGVHGSAWTRRLGDASDAFASGWMRLRGARRRRAVDRGFVLSDHADWPGLMRAITATGAARVIVTHGYEDVMVRHLRSTGLQASSFATEYGDEVLDAPVEDAPAPAVTSTSAAEAATASTPGSTCAHAAAMPSADDAA
jgi:putative mRNA 3-end processing factor